MRVTMCYRQFCVILPIFVTFIDMLVSSSCVLRDDDKVAWNSHESMRGWISRSEHAVDTFDKNTFRLLRTNKGPRAAVDVYALGR